MIGNRDRVPELLRGLVRELTATIPSNRPTGRRLHARARSGKERRRAEAAKPRHDEEGAIRPLIE